MLLHFVYYCVLLCLQLNRDSFITRFYPLCKTSWHNDRLQKISHVLFQLKGKKSVVSISNLWLIVQLSSKNNGIGDLSCVVVALFMKVSIK